MILISEYHKYPTVPRLFYLRVFSFLAILPVALTIEWPENPVFYACVFGLTAIIFLTDVLYYGAAQKHGAGPISRIEPLTTLLTFVVWTVITPAQLNEYLAQPLIATGIAGCFALAAYCAMQLRHSPVSMAALKQLSYFIGLIAIVNILGKTSMDAGGNPMHAAGAYVAIQSSVLMVLYGVLGLVRSDRHGSIRPNRGLLISAGLMAIASLSHIVTKNVAYTMVSNPAYILIILLSVPLMVSAYYKVKGRADDASVWAGFGIVISAALLIILTRF